MRHFSRTCSLLLLIAVFSGCCFSQQNTDPCAPPTFKIDKEKNMFNEHQEAWLGEILDQEAIKRYNMIEDPEGDYLQRMGERILAELPPTGRQYRFYIIDLPVNNAFSLGGSRIYVTRQLIAFLKNEDEFAGLLGHEVGHIATHQVAIDLTRVFRKVLGVDRVGDRNDIFDKWNQLEDIWRKKHAQLSDDERSEDEQRIADRIGLYTMTRAGYRPIQLADFFDRLTESEGNTGSLFTDFFGITTPTAKRLRLLVKEATPLPQPCVSARPADSAAHFLDWQKKVIASRKAVVKEQVGGILMKSTLQPPLRGNLQYLQFSPDGKYLLAQDEGTVFVLSREPLTTLFRIDVQNAKKAQFSPDSRSVVVADAELRVEKWDIAEEKRISVHAVSIPGRCEDSAVSSTGEVLACYRLHKDEHELDLFDVSTGATLFTKIVYRGMRSGDLIVLLQNAIGFVPTASRTAMQFSPDNRYFVWGEGQASVGYDLENHREISLPGRIKKIVADQFTFTAEGNIAGLNREKPSKSQLARFPSGELIEEFPLEVNGFKLLGSLIPAAKGPYILVTPANMHPIAAIDLESKKLAVGYRSTAFAIYEKVAAGEQIGGRIGLFSLPDEKQLATTELPMSYLPHLQAARFSVDGKWLAAAGSTSGGVWNVASGERVLNTKTFTGASFAQDEVLALFHKLENIPKMMSLDTAQGNQLELYTLHPLAPNKELKKIQETEKNDGHVIPAESGWYWPAGDMVVAARPARKGRITIEAHDARTYQIRWTRELPVTQDLPSDPSMYYFPSLYYSASGKSLTAVTQFRNVRTEARNNPELAKRLGTIGDKDEAVLVEVLDPATGETRGGVAIDSANFSLYANLFSTNAALSAGDTLLVYDNNNRTLVYSLKSGKQTGRTLGKFKAISSGGDRMLVENGPGNADLYDVSTLQVLEHYTFPARIKVADFTDQNTLMVLTEDQTVYQLAADVGRQSASIH